VTGHVGFKAESVKVGRLALYLQRSEPEWRTLVVPFGVLTAGGGLRWQSLGDVLMHMAKLRTLKLEDKRMQRLRSEMEPCTFSPQLNKVRAVTDPRGDPVAAQPQPLPSASLPSNPSTGLPWCDAEAKPVGHSPGGSERADVPDRVPAQGARPPQATP
jgi:hypothetical protein